MRHQTRASSRESYHTNSPEACPMSTLVYRILTLLSLVLARVPLGTDLGLMHLLFALIAGHFLEARGAVFPALASLGLAKDQVRRSEAALCYGRWQIAALLGEWQKAVRHEGKFVACEYEGVQPVACDLTAFFRPQLRSQNGSPLASKHYVSEAGKALPAVVFGLCVSVGQVTNGQVTNGQAGQTRLGLPRLLVRREEGETEALLQRRLISQAAKTLASTEALIVDAGFGLADLLEIPDLHFVARVRSNQTARRSTPPAYKGRGRRPERGELVRPLARTRAGQTIEATPPDATDTWTDGKHRLRAEIWEGLVLPDAKSGAQSEDKSGAQSEDKSGAQSEDKSEANPTTFRIVAIYDSRYQDPLLLATTLSVSASALWHLYRDRWAIEQLPLSAKPMLGAERAWVFGQESRYRLPELALLAGSLLTYIAATQVPLASGFWDRAARPTCGRMRRGLRRVPETDYRQSLERLSFELCAGSGQLRKKNSVTAHWKTGIEGHRRQRREQTLKQAV